MKFERRFTTAGQGTYDQIPFRSASSEIRNPDGTVVFSAANIEVPEQYSQVATDILAQKYFSKAGVAAKLKRVEENDVPSWLWRSVPDTKLSKNYLRPNNSAGKHPPNKYLTDL